MAECKDIRKRILELAFKAGSNGSHLGGSLSAVEILNTLYHSGFTFNPSDETRDRLILSKGHAALALYCVLESVGIITKEDAETFEQNGTTLFAHAKKNISKGIEFSGGSLSLGISYAVGVALACKSKEINNRIFVLLGDGECDEGLVWEAVMSAVNYHLDNLTFIVDCNGLQSDGYTKDVMDHSPLEKKFEGFGCKVVSVNGHSEKEVADAYKVKSNDCPMAIIAHTVKGKGVSFMENLQQWHHGTLSQSQYEQAMEEVNHE
jgi:transketolase